MLGATLQVGWFVEARTKAYHLYALTTKYESNVALMTADLHPLVSNFKLTSNISIDSYFSMLLTKKKNLIYSLHLGPSSVIQNLAIC